jgi:holin-like protein
LSGGLMLRAFAILLGFQLAGEGLVRVLALTVPGPVVGMMLLAIGCIVSLKLRRAAEAAAGVLIGNLSLLFLPAAVGIVQFLPLLQRQGWAIGAAIAGSTVLALAMTALVFRLLVRALKLENRE